MTLTLRGLAILAVLAMAGIARAQGTPVAVASIDFYGSDAIDAGALRTALGPEIERFVAMMEQARLDAGASAVSLGPAANALQQRIRAELEPLGPLAYLDFGATTDFGPPPRIHVMIDVVTERDRARRMPFRAAPTGRFEDPGGLLAAWREYQQKVIAGAYAGASLAVGDCPVLHCMASFAAPELAPYLERFNAGAREHEQTLYAIAADSGDSAQRAAALFVLAHTRDARRLLPVLGGAIHDRDSEVRNNAMRVLIHLANDRPELDFPVDALIAALDFPSASDRNKAGYALAALARQARYRDAIRTKAVPTLLRMLRLQQPNNHIPAYEILKLVSGESFGDRDYAAWERWAAARQAPAED